ncbi:MAG: extracellular solute-binding protein [Lachnospiraceae bacterium]|nr:extracellular solute-binding protein [Lachnospiraceae bacterium]
MKRNKLSLYSVLLLMLALTLTGCGKDNTGEENAKQEDLTIPAWERYASEDPVTLSWYVNYSWFVTGWGENLVSKTITEETGVYVEFVTPLGNEENKLDILIASDTLPDLITLGWWEPEYLEMIREDMVYSLNELADTYDLYFYEVADPDTVNWYTLSDGNIYGYPNSSYTPEDVASHDNIPSNQTFLVRKDIYEAIGSPDMTTIDGFYNAVKKAAQMFPEIDGKPLIPVGSHIFEVEGNVSFDQYLQNFLAIPFEKDGEYYDRNTDPEYIAWLKMFRQLCEEGYLSNDIFVDQRTQTSEKLAEGRYFCLMYQRTDLADQEKILYANDPDSIYIAVDGPKNSRGDDPVLPTNGINGWTVTMISRKCEHPERAIALLDYLISEHGQKLTYLGVEGITYDMVDGKPVLKDEVQKLLNTDREAYDALYGADSAYWMLQDNVMQLDWQPELQEPLKQMAEWTYPYVRYLGQYDITIPEDTDVGRDLMQIKTLWGTTIKKLLLAPTEEDFDRILREYVQQRKAIGYYEIVKEETRQMQENKRRLGLEDTGN